MGLNLAIMGIRGIPANYGGFETFAENLAPRLVQRGHQVTVYGRSNTIDYDGDYYKGVRLVILPTISHKYLDTVAHTFLCVWHAALKEKYDAILICNSANSAFAFIPRLAKQPVAINVDGLEWKRKKWNKLGQWYYKMSEYLSTKTANRIITDARYIKKYYLDRFNVESVFIPYGTPIGPVAANGALERLSLSSRDYVLYVSRLEPENNAHLVVKAFEKVKTNKRLVVVGDAPYSTDYIQTLKATRDPRICFTGYVFGQGYAELQSNAYVFVQATEVGGTHPALVESMGYGNCIVANDVPEHHEVLADAGLYYDGKRANDLTEKLQHLLDDESTVTAYRQLASQRARALYSWDKIVDDYEKLFYDLAKHH